MHLVWKIPELREHIFNSIELYLIDRDEPFIALSHTCRDFREPMLCRLWSVLQSFDRILKLLPKAKLKGKLEEDLRYPRCRPCSDGTISNDDVSSIRYYGKYVHTLFLGDHFTYYPCIQASDLRKIIDALGGELLFPNLVRLEYEIIEFDEFIPAILSPSV